MIEAVFKFYYKQYLKMLVITVIQMIKVFIVVNYYEYLN
jgi:hypothetical protein